MTVRILVGDVRDRLKDLPDESVHCVVSSPPYFGLRDYGTASWEGGDPACDHSSVRRGHGDEKQATSAGTSRDRIVGTDCKRCGAIRADKQIGLEDTPSAFVATMVEVFREVRRVLRADGVCWINLGDSYASAWACNRRSVVGNGSMEKGKRKDRPNRLVGGLKEKDLIGIPWRVAFALQADGWFLRQDIIWSKPNPMPESVTDRCTKAHEYLFLLSKSARYHYDAAAIAEESIRAGDIPGGSRKVDVTPYPNHSPQHMGRAAIKPVPETRNRRSVWTVATQPFSEAHFATFPPALIEPCILAGCPKDCCAKCGAPVVREVERTLATVKSTAGNYDTGAGKRQHERSQLVGAYTTTLGWSPSCSCGAGTARGVCLDPFGGAGTTGLVADRLGRDAILIELNPEYAAIADRRINADAGMFGKVEAA